MMIAGTIGGISSTITAFMAILDPDSFGDSCFVNFGRLNWEKIIPKNGSLRLLRLRLTTYMSSWHWKRIFHR